MRSRHRLRVNSPLREALEAISGQACEYLWMVGVFYSGELTDHQQEKLQDWCSINANPGWSTGIGMLEAAEHIVAEAIINANIASKDSLK